MRDVADMDKILERLWSHCHGSTYSNPIRANVDVSDLKALVTEYRLVTGRTKPKGEHDGKS